MIELELEIIVCLPKKFEHQARMVEKGRRRNNVSVFVISVEYSRHIGIVEGLNKMGVKTEILVRHVCA